MYVHTKNVVINNFTARHAARFWKQTRAESWVPCTRNRTVSDSDTYLKIDARYTGFWYSKLKNGQRSTISFQNDIFLSRIAFDFETLSVKYAVQRHRELQKAKLIKCECKAHPFSLFHVCVGSASRNCEDVLLDYEIELQNFIAVTSVLKILFALRVVFRVYVYCSGSDTYPVFQTRFSPIYTILIHICLSC